MDNMVSIMERYANNLESIIEERTTELVVEKQKTDQLLYQMLPKWVESFYLFKTSLTGEKYSKYSDISGG
jgi:hypothetical protein